MTLLELMVAFMVSLIILTSLTYAYSVSVRWQQSVPDRVQNLQDQTRFEKRLRQLIAGAYLSTNEADTHTYFVAASSSGASEISDEITFTTTGTPPSGAYLEATGTLEELNEQFGPQTGLQEVGLTNVPVGSEAPQVEGLFMRVQRPADGDPTQGGFEEVLLEGVASVQFEFFDGLDWITTWDTRTGQRRLPSAVRMRYYLENEDLERVITVALPNSDVTPENPMTQEVGGEQQQ